MSQNHSLGIDALTTHICEILAAWDPDADLLRIGRTASGLSRTVLFLETTRGDLVLRTHEDDAWKLEKERLIFAHMRSLGIPVPTVLQVDTSRGVVPFHWSLVTRISGEPFSSLRHALADDQNVEIYATLGDYLGRLHATTFTRFGDVAAALDGLVVGPVHELDTGAPGQGLGPFQSWQDMHDEIVRSRLHLMRGTGFGDLIAPIQEWFRRHRSALDIEVVPRLLHMDLHQGNVLIANGAVVGILDVEESIVGHNEYDLMRTELGNFRGENPLFRDAFMRSYEMHIPLDPGYRGRQDFYDLSRTLTWIRGLIQHGERYAHGAASHSCRAAREHVLSLIATA